ncbi:MAG TPA: NADP-dependent oxidoreductase [Polyangiaceae bacterium]|nr:NADP-dependent oxidoreductase [Polyangiaceae bacterium]
MIAEKIGGPEVLKVVERQLPPPGAGKVTVSVKAIGVNPVDLKILTGARGRAPELPWQPGFEAAGVVSAVGPGVTGRRPGDEVIVFRAAGTYGSALLVPEGALTAKPPSLSWEQAAGLLLAGATAVHALEAAHVAGGDLVLAHGAAGSVGQLLVQLARRRGASVIGTALSRNHALLRSLGATPVEYGDGLAERVHRIGAPTVAVDLVGTEEALDVSLALVADRTRVVTIVNAPPFLAAGARAIGGGPGADPGTAIRDAARAQLASLGGAGQIAVRIVKTFPLDRAADALRFVGEGHADGKAILLP